MRQIDYSVFLSRGELLRTAYRDEHFPPHLLELLNDEELWDELEPTGEEVNALFDIFADLGPGSKLKYMKALLLIREFSGRPWELQDAEFN